MDEDEHGGKDRDRVDDEDEDEDFVVLVTADHDRFRVLASTRYHGRWVEDHSTLGCEDCDRIAAGASSSLPSFLRPSFFSSAALTPPLLPVRFVFVFVFVFVPSTLPLHPTPHINQCTCGDIDSDPSILLPYLYYAFIHISITLLSRTSTNR
jgi:hypothetical protein